MDAGRNPLRLLPRVLLGIGLAGGLWSTAIWLSTGFEFSLGPLSLRAHRLDRSTTLAIVALFMAWIADVKVNRRNLPWMAIRWLGHAVWKASRPLIGVGRRAIAYRPSARVASLVIVSAIALTAAAASAYVWSIAPPLWLDEEAIALNIRDRGFLELAGPLWLGQSAPLGWLLVQHAIVRLLGTGELVLRFVPLAFGLSTIGVAIWIGRRWLNLAGQAALVLSCGLGQWLTHYRFEVKHYTADTFFALLLPALLVWALEALPRTTRLRRALIWWIVAAVGLWLANGAMLVAPACALILIGSVWRRDGLPSAVKVAAFGTIWLVAFAAHYELSMRAALQSQYLRDFWASPSQGILERFRALADNPGGSDFWISLWVSAAAGFVVARKRLLAGAFAVVPISAWILGMLGIVPLRERLALWIVPALYVGIALAADRIAAVARDAYHARRWLVLTAAVACAGFEVRLADDVIRAGRMVLAGASWTNQKQGVNDRVAVRWLMRQLRPGDAIASTHMGWPAVWWYGNIPLTNDEAPGAQLGPGIAEYQIAPKDEDCRPGELAARFVGHERVLVYIGFRDMPEGFDAVIMRRFAEAGAISSFRTFGDNSWAGIVDLRTAPDGRPFPTPSAADRPSLPLTNRCISVAPARLW